MSPTRSLLASGVSFAGTTCGIHDHLEQRRLAHAVGTDHTHDAVARKIKTQVVHEQSVAVALFQVLCDDHDIAQPRTRRESDSRSRALRGRSASAAISVAVQTRTDLALARSG